MRSRDVRDRGLTGDAGAKGLGLTSTVHAGSTPARSRMDNTGSAPPLLLFGAREARDSIREEDLLEFEQSGIPHIRKVHSSQPGNGRRQVQHEVAAREDDVWSLVKTDAAIFVCGNADTMAPGYMRRWPMSIATRRGHRGRSTGGGSRTGVHGIASSRTSGATVAEIA